MTYTSEFPIINVTVDLVILRINPEDHFERQVLLIRRKNEPFQGLLAFPGGFLEYDELPEQGALREAMEETNVRPEGLTFVKMLDHPLRDPRGRVISYLFAAWVPSNTEPVAGSDAKEALWVPLTQARRDTLAFDHGDALNVAVEALR